MFSILKGAHDTEILDEQQQLDGLKCFHFLRKFPKIVPANFGKWNIVVKNQFFKEIKLLDLHFGKFMPILGNLNYISGNAIFVKYGGTEMAPITIILSIGHHQVFMFF